MLQNDIFLFQFGFDFMPQLGTHLGIILLPIWCCFCSFGLVEIFLQCLQFSFIKGFGPGQTAAQRPSPPNGAGWVCQGRPPHNGQVRLMVPAGPAEASTFKMIQITKKTIKNADTLLNNSSNVTCDSLFL